MPLSEMVGSHYKYNEINMSKLIIVCGLPGSGKTLFARALSKETGIVCLHKDSIKDVLFEGLRLSTVEESKRIGKPSIDIMLHLAKQQIENGIDIIIEAPFNFPEDYGLFTEWENQYGVELFSVICYVDTEERRRRIEARARQGAHFDKLRMEDFFPEKEYDYEDIPGKKMKICTNKSVKHLLKEVIPVLNI